MVKMNEERRPVAETGDRILINPGIHVSPTTGKKTEIPFPISGKLILDAIL